MKKRLICLWEIAEMDISK